MKKTYDVANVIYNTNTSRSSFKVNEYFFFVVDIH